jgi:6-phosphogluconolactonase
MMMRLKSFLCPAALMLVVACSQPKVNQQVDARCALYIGTYTQNGSQGIYKVMFDTVAGSFGRDTLVAKLENPSYLCLSADNSKLLAVSEGNGPSTIYSFAVNGVDGMLQPLDTVATAGAGPCYVSLTNGNLVGVANYGSGSVTVNELDEQGQFTSKSQLFQNSGKGPRTDRQEGPHVHCVRPDLKGQYVYATDLGIDRVKVFKVAGDSLAFAGEIGMEAGAGPRHIDFHPSGKSMVVINELNQTVDVMTPDSAGIFSKRLQTVQLLLDTIRGSLTSADIHFSADGRYLYATNRGYDCVIVMKVDADSQKLEVVGRNDEKLKWPRNFTLDPSNNFVLVANQNGNDVVVYRRDKQTGLLTLTASRLEVGSPVCLKFANN